MTQSERRHRRLFAFLMGVVLTIAAMAYWPGLSGPFMLDDIPQLQPLIDQSEEPPQVLFNSYLVSTSGLLGRPVAMATFILDAIVHGENLWWWKFESLLLHLASGLVLYAFITRIAKVVPAATGINYRLLGLLVASLWLVHPLNVSTVLYTVQRMTLLSTLFVFCGLVSYCEGRLQQLRKTGKGWLAIAAAFIAFLPLAALSKESGLLLAVYLAVLEFTIFRFEGPGAVRKQLHVLHGALIAGFIGAAAFLVANPDFLLTPYEARDFSMVERVLTQSRVLVSYLLLITFPLPIWMGFFHDDFTLSTGLLSPPTTLISCIFLAGLIATAIHFRKRSPLFAFGLIYFFASHLMESTVFGLELMFEHRNYAGSSGILLAIAAPLSWLVSQQRTLVSVGLAVCLCFSFLTWQRASIWADPVTMYRHMYAIHPESRRLNMIHANVNAAAGEFEKARLALARIDPSPGRDLQAIYIECIESGEVPRHMLSATAIRDGVVESHVTSGLKEVVNKSLQSECELSREALLEVIDRLLTMKARSPIDYRAVLSIKAKLLEGMRRIDDAVATYAVIQATLDEHAVPLYLAADLLAKNGRFDDALRRLEEAAQIERKSRVVRKDIAQKIYAGIAEQYVAKYQFEEALDVYEHALSSMPRNRKFIDAAAGLQEQLRRQEEGVALPFASGHEESGPRSAEIEAGLRSADDMVPRR